MYNAMYCSMNDAMYCAAIAASVQLDTMAPLVSELLLFYW